MKNLRNLFSSTRRNNLRLFISLSIVALFAITSLLVWQTTAEMQTTEQFSINGVPTPTPLILTVTRNDDRNATCATGDCSLREAIAAADAFASDDIINFAPNLTTITLTGTLAINNTGTLTINGTGANILTIIGAGNIFNLTNATVTISGMTLTRAQSLSGGALLVAGGALTLDGVHVFRNQAVDLAGNGGGCMSLIGGTHRIVNSTLSENSSIACSCIVNTPNTTLTIVNSTISGNQSPGSRGAGSICNSGNATLRNVTITNNLTGSGGGGIFNNGTLNFGNTIVAGNIASSGSITEINFFSGTITSAGGNLVGDSPGDSTNTGPFAITYQPSDIRDVNPMLGILQNNGGRTPTRALLAGSPAIDSGLNTLAIDPSNSTPLNFDQRGTGFPRIVDGNNDNTPTVDIGAYEVQTTPTPTPTVTPTPTATPTATPTPTPGNVCTPSTTVTEGDLFPGGIVSFGVTSGAGSVTVDHVNAGTGLQLLTVVSATNAVVNIPPFTPGTQNPVVVTFTPINPGLAVDFTLRAASTFHAANIRARCAEVCTPSTTVTEGDLFPGGIVSFGISSGAGSVTVDHVNAGTGTQSLTVVGTPINAVVNIPPFTAGTTMPIVVTFTPIDPNQPVDFTLRAASTFHAANIRARCNVIVKPERNVIQTGNSAVLIK